MEISTAYNFGTPLKLDSDIEVKVEITLTLDDMWQLPNIREIIANGIAPLLRHLNMPEHKIDEWHERIMLSGELAENVKPPFLYLEGV